jgi:Na+-translocating ferredoxin:NAD+ oxidoreductase RnfC subunit
VARDLPVSKSEIVGKIFQAGVVGAGGAGFPTHLKAQASAEVVIANGCECEPLVQSDRHVLETAADDVIRGLTAMMMATGASRGVVAVRESQAGRLADLRGAMRRLTGVDLFGVQDSYPAGDEHLLVYEVTGKAIPQGGIPPEAGVVVSNVNTLANVSRAMRGEPVTSRMVSVCGDVAAPGVFEVPVGTAVGDVLTLSGNGAALAGKGVLLSGIMMGEICEDLARPVDKRTGAIVVLPRDNEVIVRKTLPVETIVKRAASVCCQCTFCTELCPRHLLGHGIAPHRIMRSVGWSRVFTPDVAGALYCSGCGLCGVFACPMQLSPDRISFMVRAEMAKRGIKVDRGGTRGVERVRPGRLVPHDRILERTGVAAYDRELRYAGRVEPGRVAVPLAQGAGVAARPVVKPGDAVRRGSLVGSVAEQQVGANVHASIDGVVTGINHCVVVEKR